MPESTGGTLRVARRGETVTPRPWSDPTHRSLVHLALDIDVSRGASVRIINAKYKSHFAEIDEQGWRQSIVFESAARALE